MPECVPIRPLALHHILLVDLHHALLGDPLDVLLNALLDAALPCGRSVIVKCSNVMCQQYQITTAILPNMDEYMACKLCGRKQPAKAFVHPVSGQTLRSYNRAELQEQVKDLEERGTPGFKRISASLKKKGAGGSSAGAAATSQAKAPTVDSSGTPGSFVQVLVPDEVQPGDTLELKVRGGSKLVRVIVDSVEAALPTSRN